ncbi:hypothetical protein [Nostoc sp.]|uniref:hypothetical protein n=1 Tax=Nostoc sp. TaxID=1180 RepID=UPI002FF51186
MKTRLGGKLIAFTTTIFLSITSLASAQTANSSCTIHDSQILPYLLDNPNENSLVRVRCLSRDRQEVDRKRQNIRNSILQPTFGDRNHTVTIEVEESCRNFRIRSQDGSDFSDVPMYHPYSDENHAEFEDSWLTREGSGWYWLLHQFPP